MPKINPDTVSDASQATTFEQVYQAAFRAGSVQIAYPVLITAVNRKVNTGGFENIDVMMGLSVPVLAMPLPDRLDEFVAAVADAAELGYQQASRETFERYKKIKELQEGGR